MSSNQSNLTNELNRVEKMVFSNVSIILHCGSGKTANTSLKGTQDTGTD